MTAQRFFACETLAATGFKIKQQEKTTRKIANIQKQKFGSPSLQTSLRCQTLAFFTF
jgi:hypothetical protein